MPLSPDVIDDFPLLTGLVFKVTRFTALGDVTLLKAWLSDGCKSDEVVVV